jgi:hypothetical protein
MADNAMNEPGKPRLVPARPPALEGDGYLPRLPWRLLGLGGAVIGLVLLGYGYRQNQKARELRASILRTYEGELAAPRATMTAARQKLERLVVASAAKRGNDPYVAAGFDFAQLREGSGLYLRIAQQSAGDPSQLRAAARQMEPDWIPSCLGLDPQSAREIYEIGEFLTPEFVAHLEDEGVMKLRVREDTVARRSASDLQKLLAAAGSRWFMLVLQEGPSRHDQPVRAFVWDLPSEKLLLAARVQSQGILLTSHILSQGVDPKSQPKLGDQSRAAANDCSIAAGVKRLGQTHSARNRGDAPEQP